MKGILGQWFPRGDIGQRSNDFPPCISDSRKFMVVYLEYTVFNRFNFVQNNELVYMEYNKQSILVSLCKSCHQCCIKLPLINCLTKYKNKCHVGLPVFYSFVLTCAFLMTLQRSLWQQSKSWVGLPTHSTALAPYFDESLFTDHMNIDRVGD